MAHFSDPRWYNEHVQPVSTLASASAVFETCPGLALVARWSPSFVEL